MKDLWDLYAFFLLFARFDRRKTRFFPYMKAGGRGEGVHFASFEWKSSYVANPTTLTLNGQILGRWVILWMLLGGHERYEKHWVCHIASIGVKVLNFSQKG